MYFCFVLIDLINDCKKNHKIVCIIVFYENCLYDDFYVHCYFLKLFLVWEEIMEMIIFIRIVTFSVKRYYKNIF